MARKRSELVREIDTSPVPRFCMVCGAPEAHDPGNPESFVCRAGHGGAEFTTSSVVAANVRVEWDEGGVQVTALVPRARKRSELPPAAARASAELAGELRAADDEIFTSSQRGAYAGPTKEVPVDAPFGRIAEKVLRLDDPERIYDEIEAGLQLGDSWNDPGKVARALDRAETQARRAHSLWMAAKVAKEAYEIDNAPVFGAMRSEAVKSLEAEKQALKENKLPAKQITDADVEARMAAAYPVDYRAHQLGRRRVKAVEESLAHLSEMAVSRCRTLQALLARQR